MACVRLRRREFVLKQEGASALQPTFLCAIAMVALSGFDAAFAHQSENVEAAETKGFSTEAVASNVKFYTINLPVLVDDFLLGEMPAKIGSDNSLAVDPERLAVLLETVLAPSTFRALKALARQSEDGVINASDISTPGVDVRYDSNEVAVVVLLDTTARQIQGLGGGQVKLDRRGALDPSNFSIGASFRVSQAYNYGSVASQRGRRPVTAAVDGFGNLFGTDGIYFVGSARYTEGASSPLQRDDILVFHDFENSALRLSFGDLPITSLGRQAPPLLGGLSFGRLYNEIQPLRNVRSTGRAQFSLERASTVDVVVNGVTTQTLSLTPGSYDLRDLGLITGLNDVLLVAEDDVGRTELYAGSIFAGGTQLEPGLSIFNVSIGFPRSRTEGSYVYDTSQPTFTGFFQYGFSDRLTFGVSADADGDVQVLGAQAIYSTNIGNFTLDGAVSRSEFAAPGASVNFLYRLPLSSDREALTFDLTAEYNSETFATPSRPLGNFDTEWRTSVQASRTFPYEIRLATGANFTRSRTTDSVSKSYSVTATKLLGPVNAALTLSRISNVFETSNRALLTMSVPLGRKQRLRAIANTEQDTAELQWTRTRQNIVNDWSAQVTLGRNDESYGVQSDFEYRHNRFVTRLQNIYVKETIGDRETERIARADFGFGVGFADGKFGVGQPLTSGFAVVSGHKSLEGRKIEVDGSGEDRPGRAFSGFLGPALLPVDRGYTRREIPVVVEDLPPGVDIGGGEIVLAPGAFSGYAVVLGSAASNTVLGVLLKSNGEPASLIGGMLVPTSGDDAVESTFFTNRAGRFVAERVAPGTYDITYGDDVIGELTISEDAEGLVRVGDITTTLGD